MRSEKAEQSDPRVGRPGWAAKNKQLDFARPATPRSYQRNLVTERKNINDFYARARECRNWRICRDSLAKGIFAAPSPSAFGFKGQHRLLLTRRAGPSFGAVCIKSSRC